MALRCPQLHARRCRSSIAARSLAIAREPTAAKATAGLDKAAAPCNMGACAAGRRRWRDLRHRRRLATRTHPHRARLQRLRGRTRNPPRDLPHLHRWHSDLSGPAAQPRRRDRARLGTRRVPRCRRLRRKLLWRPPPATTTRALSATTARNRRLHHRSALLPNQLEPQPATRPRPPLREQSSPARAPRLHLASATAG
jgi:hypothetical protein